MWKDRSKKDLCGCSCYRLDAEERGTFIRELLVSKVEISTAGYQRGGELFSPFPPIVKPSTEHVSSARSALFLLLYARQEVHEKAAHPVSF